jgi:hypothetical protein
MDIPMFATKVKKVPMVSDVLEGLNKVLAQLQEVADHHSAQKVEKESKIKSLEVEIVEHDAEAAKAISIKEKFGSTFS